MNIAIVTSEFPPVTRYSGGIGFHFAATAVELVRQGHSVRVLTRADGDPGTVAYEGVVVTTRRPPDRSLLPTRLAWARVVREWIDALDGVDVIFAPEWGGEAALCAGRAGHPPVVTNLATSLRQIRLIEQERVSVAGRLRDGVQHWLEARQARRSAGILACSHAVLSWSDALWSLGDTPSTVLPNFTDVDRIRAYGRGPLPEAWPNSGPVVLYFGRLERRKGVHVLAEAVPRIAHAVPGTQFVFIGATSEFEGRPMSDSIWERVGPTFASDVHLLGPLDVEQLLPAVAAADVAVFPSLWENFSIAAVEARVLGRPIVATSGNGFDDFVRDGVDGVLVPPNDAVALSAGVTGLLRDAGRRAELGRAAAQAADLLRPEPVVRSYVEFFASVAGSGAPPG